MGLVIMIYNAFEFYDIFCNIKIDMINSDFSTLAVFRGDGRKSEELRQTNIELGIDANYEGSCLYRQGLTQVLCLIKGPYQRQNQNQNLLKIDYSVAPFSSLEKRKMRFDKQYSQFAQSIRKSFQAVIIADTYQKSQIEVTVAVIQNEGSAKSCIMNCITLGLASAGICMRDLLVSCTVGTHNGNYIIDTNEEEEYDTANQIVVSYMANQSKIDFLELQKAKIKEEELKKLYNLAIRGCFELHKKIKRSLYEYARKKLLVF